VRGILGADDADSIGGPSGKRGNDSEQVFLREDVERDGDAAVAITDDRVRPEEADAEQRWTHERVKAVTDERVYAAKNDASSGLLNAVVAKQTRAPSSGTAKIELERMIEKMEEFELAQDDALPALDEFEDGGLGDLQDDFILQAMLGGDETSTRPQSSFPPIRLRYDDAEVDNALATVEEIVEEDLLEEEEEGLASGAVFGGGGGRGPGSDAGTDRDLDEDEWAEQRAADLGAEARDVDTLFEAMARGYDSDEIGELDEDDPRIFGRAELDRFGSVLEAFRAERRPEQYRTAAETAMGGANADEFDRRGRELRKRDDDALFEDDGLDDVDMRRAKPLLDDLDEDGIERSKPAVPRITRDDVHDAFRAMVATRRRAGLEIPTRLMRKMGLEDETDDGSEGVPENRERTTKDDALPARRFELEDDDDRRGAPDGEEIEYLRNAPRESWDCETIVSTYSNLENHPSVIDEPHGGSGSGRGKRRGATRRDGDGGGGANGPGASLIRLSQTNGLPVDYVQSRRGKGRGGSLLTAANLAAIGEDGDGDERFADDGSDEEEEDIGEEWRSNIRRKGETPEEKKARKAAVKAGRRDARAAKKGLKTTFKQEEREMGKKAMVGDVRPGLSVTQLG
jgi:protein LTV1